MQAAGNRRRVRQGRAGRRSPQHTVNPEALKTFWSSLTLLERLQVLQFEERDLCERAYVIQQMLWYSELMCIKSGVRVSDGAGKGVHSFAMEAFEFKWHLPGAPWLRACRSGSGDGAGGLVSAMSGESRMHNVIPAAFAARLDFVEGEDFIDRLEKRLGTGLLDGLPAMRREDWASVFEPTANSWAEYERQVLKLVRLALVQAHQDFEAASALEAPSPKADTTEMANTEAQVDLENVSCLDPVPSPGGKRKTRKRRKAAAAAVAAGSRADSCRAEDEVLDAEPEDDNGYDEEEHKVVEGFEEGHEEVCEETEVAVDEEEGEEDEEEEEEEEDDEEDTAAVEEEAQQAEQLKQRVETLISPDKEPTLPATRWPHESEVAVSSGIDDEGFAAWETVSRKRDRQRARTQSTTVPSPSKVQYEAAEDRTSTTDTTPRTTNTTSAVAASIIATSATPIATTTAAEARLSAWQPNAEKYKMWMPDASEAICIMASIKRTFLEVEPVLRSEKMRPRSRSVGPAIWVC